MGFGYILIGMIFLFNPNINVFDVLPDFIGFLLIYRGLFAMSFASSKLADVRQNTVWKLALITGLRTGSLLLLPYTSDTFTLVLVFVFAVLEVVYLIPMVTVLFDGFYDLGTRFDCEIVFDTRICEKKRGKYAGKRIKLEGAERLKAFTVLFFLVKAVASVLPELTSLEARSEYTSDARLYLRLSDYRPLFYLVCTVLVLLLGIVWLVRMMRYLLRLRRDPALSEAISQYYAEHIATQPQMLVALRMKKIRILLLLCAISTFSITVDGVTVLPKIVLFAFACAVFALLLRWDRLAISGIVLSALSGVYSLVNMTVQIPYYREYSAMDARYFTGAAMQYGKIRTLGILEYVLCGAVLVLLLICCFRAARMHCDYIRLGAATSQYSGDARRAEIVATVRGSALWCGLFAVLYSVLGCAAYYLTMYYLSAQYLVTVASIVFVIAAYRFGATAHEEVYDRLERNY